MNLPNPKPCQGYSAIVSREGQLQTRPEFEAGVGTYSESGRLTYPGSQNAERDLNLPHRRALRVLEGIYIRKPAFYIHWRKKPSQKGYCFIHKYSGGQIVQNNLNRIPNNELIKGCSNHSESYESYWLEFKYRFDDAIAQFIKKTLHRHNAEFYPSQLEDKISEYKQEVYLKLLKNNAGVLRNFIGVHENSIFKYLEMICKSCVLNSFRLRRSRYKNVSIDELTENKEIASSILEEAATYELLKKEILLLIKRIYNEKKQRNLGRNIGIFRLHFFYGFTTRQISHFKFVKLSSSGVDTVLNRIRTALATVYRDDSPFF